MNRRRRVTYRPNKTQSIFGGVMGGIFVLIGVFVVIPTFGAFGAIWTLIAAVITGMNLYQGFGKKYIGPEINIEDETDSPGAAHADANAQAEIGLDSKARLEQLQRLLDSGLITREEFAEKRQQILSEL